MVHNNAGLSPIQKEPGTNMKGILLEVPSISPGEVIYNPAVIIQRNPDTIASGAHIIAARIEQSDSSWLTPKLYNPQIRFFTKQDTFLVPVPNVPVFNGFEDPWATWLRGSNGRLQLLFGAVKVDFSVKEPIITTELFLAASVKDLDESNPIAQIRGYKDIRVAQLHNGNIAVFTRPTKGEAYPGRIGFTVIHTIEEIEQSIDTARLLPFTVDKNARIGANEVYEVLTDKSTLHVFCHIATTDPLMVNGKEVFDFDRGIIHYAGYTFDLDSDHPYDERITLKKVADRSDFPANKGLNKGDRYKDVVFPGGTGGPDESLYFAGVEDARIGIIDLNVDRETKS